MTFKTENIIEITWIVKEYAMNWIIQRKFVILLTKK